MSVENLSSGAKAVYALDEALSTARRDGWCLLNRSVSAVAASVLPQAGSSTGLRAIPHRTGKNVIAELCPTKPAAAAQRSLSASYGQGEFPLHTDGAYMTQPPEFVLLELVGGPKSSVPTTLVHLRTIIAAGSRADLELGMFRVQEHGGTASYLPALKAGRIRFDANCMVAADPRSRRVASAVQELEVEHEHYWDSSGATLVIHNWTVLHARGDATGEPDRKLHRLLLLDDRQLR